MATVTSSKLIAFGNLKPVVCYATSTADSMGESLLVGLASISLSSSLLPNAVSFISAVLALFLDSVLSLGLVLGLEG